MDLKELVRQTQKSWSDEFFISGTTTDVSGICYDSRNVTNGELFCCLRGRQFDGHNYAANAIKDGATALLVDRQLDLAVPQVLVRDTRRAMALLAASFFGHPSEHLKIAGVTGTNGKTSVVSILAHLLRMSDWMVAESGTLTGVRTTPEAPELQLKLSNWLSSDVEAVCMEVSSHALAQHRIDGTKFELVAYTNLTRDHLDYHESMFEYGEAKQRLFTREFSNRAVIVIDDVGGRIRAKRASREGLDVVEVSTIDAIPEFDSSGSAFTWRGERLYLPLPGSFALTNALVAAELAVGLGLSEDRVADALPCLLQVKGRFEFLPETGGVHVVVDYAHTPQALTNVLYTARQIADTGRVICVFGCGGGRDAGKRPEMGLAALCGADAIIVTSDNPRTESPDKIIEEILAGMKISNSENDLTGTVSSGRVANEVLVEPDRREAIAIAIGMAKPGDLILIAGKGHENIQEIGEKHYPFDDRIVALELLGGAE